MSLPEGWEIVAVGDIADCSLGKMLSRNQNRGTPKPYLRNVNVRWFDFDLSGLKEMPFEDHESEKYTAKAGDLMICEGGYPGRAAIWDRSEPIHFQKAVHRVRMHEPGRNRWLLYYLWMLEASGKLADYCTGTGIRHFTGRALKALPLPLPPLSEQRRIVGVLDAAFAGLATAQAHTRQTLTNARELFESQLNAVFSQDSAGIGDAPAAKAVPQVIHAPLAKGAGTRTGGRAATDQHIPGPLSLCVNAPKTPAKSGWKWRRLTDLARLETGHTPSRRRADWWGGDVPWIGIKDAKAHHGEVITATLSNTNDEGLANSAARLLPAGTVCLSRTASIGYVTVMGADMATSQDFVNWVCSSALEPHFLKYLLLAEGEGIKRFGSGSVHTTIYFPEVKAFCIACPDVEAQRDICRRLDRVRADSEKIADLAERKLALLTELKQSLLHRAFSGTLSESVQYA